MRFPWIGLAFLGALGCGGSSFSAGSPGGADGGGGSTDAAMQSDSGEAGATTTDAGSDVADAAGGVALGCGPGNVCKADTPTCCFASNTNMFSCAHQECGCATQLTCRRRDDCGAAQVCCAESQMDATCATASGHTVSTCTATTACRAPNGRVLCDPNGSNPCPLGLVCKTDSTSLAQVGLVPGYGFGVCGL